MRSIAAVALTGSLTALLAAPPAAANGRFPRTQEIVFGPDNPAVNLAIRTTFGIVTSDDGGQTFQFLCEDAFQYLDGQDPTIALGTDGALLVGIDGGLLAMYDRCVAHRLSPFEGQGVIDLAVDATGQSVYAAMNSTDNPTLGRVARSADGGRTFVVPPTGLVGATFETVDVAPSLPTRVYATAYDATTRSDRFYRSDDGGVTLTATRGSFAGVSGAFIAGVDRTNTARVYVRVMLASSDGADASSDSTALLRSDDGGDSFVEIARTQSPMYGFALSDDGRHVWIGGSDAARDGLQRSDDGGPFAVIRASSVQCLRYHGGTLYQCEAFQPGGTMVSRSVDDGATFQRFVGFGDIGAPPPCPASTIVGSLCPARWSAVRSVIAPASGGDASRDGGGPAASGACGCRTPGAPRGAHGAAAAAVFALGACLVRWRRKRARA